MGGGGSLVRGVSEERAKATNTQQGRGIKILFLYPVIDNCLIFLLEYCVGLVQTRVSYGFNIHSGLSLKTRDGYE